MRGDFHKKPTGNKRSGRQANKRVDNNRRSNANARVNNAHANNARGNNTYSELSLPDVQRSWLVRSTLVLGFLGLIAAGLTARAAWLQVFDNEFLAAEGDKRHNRVLSVPASRGVITDRNGLKLADSTPVETIWLDPTLFEVSDRSGAELNQLADLVDMSAAELKAKLEGYQDKRFMYLQRGMAPEQAGRLIALGNDLNLKGIQRQREYLRVYPKGELAAHVVGFTNSDGIGKEGMERAYEKHLLGKPGKVAFIKDRKGRVVGYRDGDVPAVAGNDVKLSIDLRLQHIAYRELASAVSEFGARGGSLVILDPQNGQVLAMVNQPGYNPNDIKQRVGKGVRNRSVTDEFEPGSTVKPFLMATALETGNYTLNSKIDTAPGRLKIGNFTVSDPRSYGVIDLTKIIVKSSNVGSAKIALSLEKSVLYSMYSRLGFGRPTYVGFPGEISGRLHHFDRWYESNHASIGYGYGLTVTNVQLAQAYAVLAAEGKKFPLTLISQDSPTQAEQVMDPQIARDVTGMLEKVVAERGTGKRAIIPGYRVAGKTGTVHKVKETGGGYSENRYRALFSGFAPVSNPKFVVVVMIDEPDPRRHFGGQVAAPIFAKVMSQALRVYNIKPDALDVGIYDLKANDDVNELAASNVSTGAQL